MSTLGKRLDQVRELMGLTLEEFGTYLGYGKKKTAARQVMSRMINDHRLPTFDNLKKLQKEGVDLNWLLNGIGTLNLENESDTNHFYVRRHSYDGPVYVESVTSRLLGFLDIINMQGKEIYTVKINSEMMSPTIKIGDTVNAVKVNEVVQDGLYVMINEINGELSLWLKRLFMTPSSSFNTVCDNPAYPNIEVEKQFINSNRLNLRVFSIMLTVDKIPQ